MIKRILLNVFHILENIIKFCILTPHLFIPYSSYPLPSEALTIKGHEVFLALEPTREEEPTGH